MRRFVSQCSICGETVSAEIIWAGRSMVCAWCDASAKQARVAPKRKGPQGIAQEQRTWKELLGALRNQPVRAA